MSKSEICQTDTISHWLIQVTKAHRARAQEVLAESGLYAGQEMILMSLWNENGQSLTQLSKDLCVQPATITKMVNRMVKAGFLERRPNPHDGRAKQIFLTEAAHKLRQETLVAWDQLEANTTAKLTATECRTLRALLIKVADGLQEASIPPQTTS